MVVTLLLLSYVSTSLALGFQGDGNVEYLAMNFVSKTCVERGQYFHGAVSDSEFLFNKRKAGTRCISFLDYLFCRNKTVECCQSLQINKQLFCRHSTLMK